MNPTVDQSALKVNQSLIIGLLVVAFLANWTWLVAFVAAVMVVGTLWPQAGLFKLAYARLLKPRGWVKPDVVADDPAPHLFAQGLGGLVLTGSAIAFLAGASTPGWLLVGVVVVLAAVNLFLGFCLGCFVYYQMARRGIHATLPRWQAARLSAPNPPTTGE